MAHAQWKRLLIVEFERLVRPLAPGPYQWLGGTLRPSESSAATPPTHSLHFVGSGDGKVAVRERSNSLDVTNNGSSPSSADPIPGGSCAPHKEDGSTSQATGGGVCASGG